MLENNSDRLIMAAIAVVVAAAILAIVKLVFPNLTSTITDRVTSVLGA